MTALPQPAEEGGASVRPLPYTAPHCSHLKKDRIPGRVSSEGERESERERERANGKGKGCEAIKEFKRRGGRDAEPYLDVDHDERRWDQ